MKAQLNYRRRGLSLIELLVVVAILGLLAITVVPTLATTTETRRSREAARVVSSFITRSQTRAMGRSEWSGFRIDTNNPTSSAALDLVVADVPNAYRGDTSDATVSIAASGDPRSITFSTGAKATVGSGAGLVNVREGDLIRFGGQGAWYEVNGDLTAIKLRSSDYGAVEAAGQTARNTPWPTSGVNFPFEIHRQPEAAGAPTSIPSTRVIDLYWSGYGPSSTFESESAGTTRFFVAGTPPTFRDVDIMFDSTGRLRKIFFNGRKTVTGPVFLLVGRSDRAGQLKQTVLDPNDDTLGANWQYSDSYWIGIDPASGVIRTAGCVPNAATVFASQDWIRKNLLESGG